MTDEESSRARILAAAQQLFARHGFDATPTSQVARLAGVPKGLVHYYFNRKSDLLVALVDELPAEHVDPAEVVTVGDLTTSLRSLAVALDARLEQSSLLSHLLWREADTHETVREAMQRRYRTLVDTIGAVITEASPRRLPGSRVAAAASLLAHALSYRHSTARHDGGCGEDGTFEAELEFVSRGLLTQL